jgi:glycosyltransferase involved in cell wall biosynthesis
MRIAMVISTPFPPEEGIGYYAFNLSKKLIERGNEVTVFTRGSLVTVSGSVDGIRTIALPFFPFYPIHVHLHGISLNRILRRMDSQFDLIHVHSPLSPTPSTKLPVISTIHTSVVEDAMSIEIQNWRSYFIRLQSRFVSYRLVKKLMEKSRIVTTVSESVAGELSRHYGFNEAVVVGNGVDERVFQPSPQQVEEGYLLYIGRLSYRKGALDLLEIMREVLKHRRIQLIVCGKGELEGGIKKKIANDKELRENVTLLGHIAREEMPEIYRNATIFVLPSRYEGLPTVVLEAMASGVPVIAKDIPSLKDVIVSNSNGVLVREESHKAFGEAILSLLENQEQRRSMGCAARKTIEEGYTWDYVSKRFIDLYESAQRG